MAATASVLVLTACGSDDGKRGETSTAGGGASAAAEKGIDDGKPPVVLALNSLKIPAADLLTPYRAGAEAAVRKINAEGGFGGRRAVLESCNTAYQPATTVVCARKTLEKRPVAMIGCEPTWANAGLPVYAKAKVPSINCINVTEDGRNPLSFGMQQGNDGGQRAMARYLCTRDDVKTVAVFTQDIPIQRTNSPRAVGPVLEGCGKTVSYTYYPITGGDLLPYITQAAKKQPDFVITLGGGQLAVSIFKGFGSVGIPADKLIISTNAMSHRAVLEPGGAALDGAYAATEVHSWSDTADPEVAEYLRAMEGSGVEARDTGPQTGYMQVMTVFTAAKEIGFDAFDSASLTEFLSTADGVHVPLTREIRNPGPKDYPQVKQPLSQIVQWKDGKLNVVTEGTDEGWIPAF